MGNICFMTKEFLDPSELRKTFEIDSSFGAYVAFEGIVRDHNHGREVTYIVYEIYETLALKEMRCIVDEALSKFKVDRCRAIHRYGKLQVGEVAVIVQVGSGHRKPAFLAGQYIIDEIKKRVPVWKNEFYKDGSASWTRCHEIMEGAIQ